MTTLGSCLLSNDIPFEGMAKDIVERRIQGQSWKQIGEDLNIGSPGAARKAFTKLTGLTDYKIKGTDLLKLVQKGPGIPEPPNIPSTPSKTAAKKAASQKVTVPPKIIDSWKHYADNAIEAANITPSTKKFLRQVMNHETDWADLDSIDNFFKIANTYGIKNPDNLKIWMEQGSVVNKVPKKVATKAEVPNITSTADEFDWELDDLPSTDDISITTRNQILTQHQKKQGYAAIQSKVPNATIDQIDRVVARYELMAAKGDIYKALQAKPNSLILQQKVSDKVWAAVQKGITKSDITKHLGTPGRLVDDIVKANGQWKLPFGQKLPEPDAPEIPLPKYAHVSGKPVDMSLGDIESGFGKGLGNTDEDLFPRATNTGLKDMRDRQWAKAVSSEDRHYPEFYIRQYTGSAYHSINGSLRRSSTGRSTSTQVKNMDAGMYEVDEAFSVTRGMGREGFGLGHLDDQQIRDLIGKVFQDRGFLSTSTKPVFSNQVRLNIEVPVGARGHWAKPISQHSGEDEFILARGTNIQILGIERKGHSFIVRGRVIV